jgi:RNA polymerase sigma-70 factor (sigma-E family)
MVPAGPAAVFGYLYRNDQRGCIANPVATWSPFARRWAVSDDDIPSRDARDLADCFAAQARDLFGYGCVLAQGDQAQAGDLVQAAFEAAFRAWQAGRIMDAEQRRGWLRSTLVTLAMNGLRPETSPPDRLPRIDDWDRKSKRVPVEQAFPATALERSWQAIQDMPHRHHAVGLLHWHLDMKVAEIAGALDLADVTVSTDLDRARRRLITQVAQDHQGTGDDTEEDVLLARLYQQVTAAQEARFSLGYDLARGLDRYRTWLRADLAVNELFSVHYRSLVRLAAMLVRDTPTAEEVVQDAFVDMHRGWHRLEDTEKALAYLRQAVVNKSRSVLRHRIVVEKNLQNGPPDMPSAEHGALIMLERDAVVAALRKLPERQREAIVLRYYADLSEADIAATMKISRGAVKSHTARGMAALRTTLESQ